MLMTWSSEGQIVPGTLPGKGVELTVHTKTYTKRFSYLIP